MKCPGGLRGQLGGFLLLYSITVSAAMPPDTATLRSRHPIEALVRKLTKQLTDSNNTSIDITLDVRTPPKVKQQLQNKLTQKEENSHAGIAIPVDEDSIELEEANKMMHFYKLEKPKSTTDSGLSTWILLSGQPSATRKPDAEDKVKKGNSTTEKPVKLVKPFFKKKTTTSTSTTTTSSTTTTITTTEKPTVRTTSTTTLAPKAVKETTKLTRVKASELTSAKKNASSVSSVPKKVSTSTTTTISPTTVGHPSSTSVSKGNSSSLPAEAKQGELELNKEVEKKKKTATKKKKNKTRRRKPDGTLKKPNKTSVKEKPIGTQLYNYLSREIMPTVGAGLVGLMITAGLAGYFLYPFGGITRRNIDVDRKDKEGYYYTDDYSNGMLEEEAIGNIIAGMPQNSLYGNEYSTKSQLVKNGANNNYHGVKYRLVDRKSPIHHSPTSPPPPLAQEHMVKGTVESVPLDDYHHRRPYDDQKFVVGNIPTELTPATVPEHGPRLFRFSGDEGLQPHTDSGMPRSIKVRRKRSGMSNDIDGGILDEPSTTTTESLELSTMISTKKSTSISSTSFPEITSTTEVTDSTNSSFSSFFHLMKDLIHIKAKIGLQIIRNVTDSISKYIGKVQNRLDDHYKNHTNRHFVVF